MSRAPHLSTLVAVALAAGAAPAEELPVTVLASGARPGGVAEARVVPTGTALRRAGLHRLVPPDRPGPDLRRELVLFVASAPGEPPVSVVAVERRPLPAGPPASAAASGGFAPTPPRATHALVVTVRVGEAAAGGGLPVGSYALVAVPRPPDGPVRFRYVDAAGAPRDDPGAAVTPSPLEDLDVAVRRREGATWARPLADPAASPVRVVGPAAAVVAAAAPGEARVRGRLVAVSGERVLYAGAVGARTTEPAELARQGGPALLPGDAPVWVLRTAPDDRVAVETARGAGRLPAARVALPARSADAPEPRRGLADGVPSDDG